MDGKQTKEKVLSSAEIAAELERLALREAASAVRSQLMNEKATTLSRKVDAGRQHLEEQEAALQLFQIENSRIGQEMAGFARERERLKSMAADTAKREADEASQAGASKAAGEATAGSLGERPDKVAPAPLSRAQRRLLARKGGTVNGTGAVAPAGGQAGAPGAADPLPAGGGS